MTKIIYTVLTLSLFLGTTLNAATTNSEELDAIDKVATHPIAFVSPGNRHAKFNYYNNESYTIKPYEVLLYNKKVPQDLPATDKAKPNSDDMQSVQFADILSYAQHKTINNHRVKNKFKKRKELVSRVFNKLQKIERKKRINARKVKQAARLTIEANEWENLYKGCHFIHCNYDADSDNDSTISSELNFLLQDFSEGLIDTYETICKKYARTNEVVNIAKRSPSYNKYLAAQEFRALALKDRIARSDTELADASIDESNKTALFSQYFDVLNQIKQQYGSMPKIAYIVLNELYDNVEFSLMDNLIKQIESFGYPDQKSFTDRDVAIYLSDLQSTSPLDIISLKNIRNNCFIDNHFNLYASLLRPFMQYSITAYSPEEQRDFDQIKEFIDEELEEMEPNSRDCLLGLLNITATFEGDLAYQLSNQTNSHHMRTVPLTIIDLDKRIKAKEMTSLQGALLLANTWYHAVGEIADLCSYVLKENGKASYTWEDYTNSDSDDDSGNDEYSSYGYQSYAAHEIEGLLSEQDDASNNNDSISL